MNAKVSEYDPEQPADMARLETSLENYKKLTNSLSTKSLSGSTVGISGGGSGPSWRDSPQMKRPNLNTGKKVENV